MNENSEIIAVPHLGKLDDEKYEERLAAEDETSDLESRLSEAIKKRDSIDGLPGLKPPAFWNYQAEIVSLTQQIARRTRRNENG